jgi:hypothetical protein
LLSSSSAAIQSNARAAFRIDNREVGDLFFSASKYNKSQPRFGVEIFELEGRGGEGVGLGIITQRECNGLFIFLGYNSVAFHPD